MIDNIELIRPLLDFGDPDDFYMLYVFKRKKDQPEGEKDNHQSVRTIRSYCIGSMEQLDRRYGEIKMLCEVFKARAYIHVAKQNHSDVSLEMMIELATRIKSNSTKQQGLFDSVVSQIKTRESRWIVDIDDVKEVSPLLMAFIDNECRPIGPKIETIIPTRNGAHLITKRFDVKTFKEKYPEIDIQRKNPTLLYYPNSLN